MSDGPSAADLADLLRDYEQTLVTWRMLVDIRFRLLAFVPVVTGVVVTLAGRSASDYSTLIAATAMTALFGVLVYDLRNSAFHDAAVHRAKALERAMRLRRLSDQGNGSGGLMNERPRERHKLLGVPVWHDRGLFLIYSSSFGGLAGLFVLGIVAEMGVGPAWRMASAGAAAVAVFACLLWVLHRYDRRVRRPQLPPS
ncbi:hypothetical protein [Actinacidiphila glaucinigra]|uniref:hypothetical protein n=1 Tax=Actinacidiphila glaucinigra TaxID=235986 RepID=UPI0035D9764A